MGLLSFGKKAKRQFHSSLEASYVQEKTTLKQLALQQKALLKTLQVEKEEAFKAACEQIKIQMEWIRASLQACRVGEGKIVEMLLKEDALRAAFFNFYPLQIAAEHQQIEVIKLLCQCGVNVHRINAEGYSALELAEMQGHREAVELLNHLAKESERLWQAVEQGNITDIQAALERGADINATNPQGYNALQLAILHHQSTEAINLLIDAKADIHALNAQAQNVLELAILHKHSLLVIRTLVEKGAHLDEQSRKLGKTVEELSSQHPDEQIRTYLSEALGKQRGHFIEAQVDNNLAGKGPAWNESWNLSQYCSTIQYHFVTVNGQKQLFLLGRSAKGILLNSYDFTKGSWIEHPKGPEWSDNGGWKNASYYSTLQLQSVRASEGQEKLLLLGRNKTHMELWSYELHLQKWILCSPGPQWSDKEGWNQPSSFMSIRSLMVHIDGKDKLFLLGKRKGIELWSYDPSEDRWESYPAGPFSEDPHNCPLFASTTLQMQTLKTADDQQKLLVLRMTPKQGIELWSYDLNKRSWEKESAGPKCSDNTGWQYPEYYATLQTRVVRIEREEHLFLLGRGYDGIHLWSYNPNTREWVEQTMGPEWTDKRGWRPHCYSLTIQMNVLPSSSSTDIITVFGRGADGGRAFAYYPKTKQWLSLSALNLSLLNNSSGWHVWPYYSTIRAQVASVQQQNRIFTMAKSQHGVQCWSHTINVNALEKQFTANTRAISLPETIDNEKIQAFSHKILTASQQLLESAQKGDWLGVKESLLQGADIHTVDSEGYNALQKAILSKNVPLALLNGLIEAGIELDTKTLTLAERQVPKIAHLFRDEPVLGLRQSLTPPVTLEDFKLRFEDHCDKAQRFLDKYSSDTQRIQAMLAYYDWVSKVEPYALYAFPVKLMLGQLPEILNKAEEVLPTEALKGFSKESILKSAEQFFKRARAMHYLLNEMGTSHIDLSEWRSFDSVTQSVQLKREAEILAKRLGTSLQDTRVVEELYKTHHSLFIEGTASALMEFGVQVFGQEPFKQAQAEAMASELLAYQRRKQALLKEQGKEFTSQNTKVIQELAKQGLIQLSPKVSLKRGLELWGKSKEDIQYQIEQGEETLKREKEALHQWLNQTEEEWLERLKRFDELTSMSSYSYLQREFKKAHVALKQNFSQYRQELEQSYQKGRKKSHKNLTKQLVALGVAALLAPQLAPHIVSTMGFTGTVMAAKLTLVVEGALMGAMTSALSGNTNRILKDGLMGAWLAGFGMAMGSVLEESAAIKNLNKVFSSEATLIKAGETVISQGVVTHAMVNGMKTAIQVELEGGKLSTGLLNAIGTTLALGGSREIGLVQKLNETLVSVLVSSTMTSLITRSDFVENTAVIGASTLVQSSARQLGSKVADLASKEQIRRNQNKVLAAAQKEEASEIPLPGVTQEKLGYLKTASSKQAARSQRLAHNEEASLEKVQSIKSSESLEMNPAIDATVTQPTLTEALEQQDTRSGFEKARDKVLVTIANGLSGEAQAAELTSEEKALFFTYNPETHKKFFGRFLPEKPQSTKGFLAENQRLKAKEVSESSKRTASEDNLCDYTSLNTFNDLIPITAQAENACISSRRQAEFNLGVAFDTAQLGVEMAEGIVHAGVLAEELEQPRFRQSAEVREWVDHAEKTGSVDNVLDLGNRYVQALEARQRAAEEAFIKGDYFTAGRLGNLLRPGIEVGTVVLGAVGSAKLVWSVSTAATRLSAQGFKTAARQGRQLISNYEFRSPITFQFDNLQSNAFRLNGGIPVDFVKLRSPLTKKDVLSNKAKNYPVALLEHEELIVEQWAIDRLNWLERYEMADMSQVNSKMKDLLDACYNQVRDHMTPDDLAAILKEQKGYEIPKSKGGTYKHLEIEWKQAQQSFENALRGPWSGSLEETEVLSKQFGNISRVWDRFDKLIERAKCNLESSKLRN